MDQQAESGRWTSTLLFKAWYGPQKLNWPWIQRFNSKKISLQKRSLVKLTSKGREWRITSDINPTLVGDKSYLTSDLDPTDPSTNIIEPDQSLKNTKKTGLDFSPLGLTDEQIIEWKDLRKKAKAPVNQRAINMIGKEFDKSRQAGFTNDQILDLLSEKGWKGYKHEWMLNSNQTMGAQAHGQQQTTKEYNGIGYGEFADQSIFPNYLQIARNDMPDIKASREAAQLTYLKTYGTQVLGSDGAALRASLENDEWQWAKWRMGLIHRPTGSEWPRARIFDLSWQANKGN